MLATKKRKHEDIGQSIQQVSSELIEMVRDGHQDSVRRHYCGPSLEQRFQVKLDAFSNQERRKILIALMKVEYASSYERRTLDNILATYQHRTKNDLNILDEDNLFPLWYAVNNNLIATVKAIVETDSTHQASKRLILGYRNNNPIFLSEELFLHEELLLHPIHLLIDDIKRMGSNILPKMNREEQKHFAFFLVQHKLGEKYGDWCLMQDFVDVKFNMMELFTVNHQQKPFIEHYCDQASLHHLYIKKMHFTPAMLTKIRAKVEAEAEEEARNFKIFFAFYDMVLSKNNFVMVHDNLSNFYSVMFSFTFEAHEPLFNLLVKKQQNMDYPLRYFLSFLEDEDNAFTALKMIARDGHIDTLKGFLDGSLDLTNDHYQIAKKIASDADRAEHAFLILIAMMKKSDYDWKRLQEDLKSLKLWIVDLKNTNLLQVATILLDFMGKPLFPQDLIQITMEVLYTCTQDCDDTEILQKIVFFTQKYGYLSFYYDACEKLVENIKGNARDILAQKIAILECLVCRYEGNSQEEKQYRDHYRAELLACANNFMCVNDNSIIPAINIAIDSVADPLLREHIRQDVNHARATDAPVLLALMKAYNDCVIKNTPKSPNLLHTL